MERQKVDFHLDEKNYMGTLLPKEIRFESVNEEEVRRALENPIGSARLKDIVKPGERSSS